MPIPSCPSRALALAGAVAGLVAASGCVTTSAVGASPAGGGRHATQRTAAPAPAAAAASGFASLEAVVTSVTFFESGEGGLPRAERAYTTAFVGAKTRFLNWEASLRYRPPRQKVEFVIEADWIDPGGRVIRHQRLDAFVRAGTTTAWHCLGFGNATPGAAWRDGSYRVVLSVEGKEIASGSFRVLAAR